MEHAVAAVDLMPRLEMELARPVLVDFQQRGLRVAGEVPFNGRIADVVAVDDADRVTTVELKLTDWRTAHRQALAYQVGAHRSFVALPLVVVEKRLKRDAFVRAFEESGCGLLAVNHPFDDVREVIPARESTRCLPFLAEHLARLVRAVNAVTATPVDAEPATGTGRVT